MRNITYPVWVRGWCRRACGQSIFDGGSRMRVVIFICTALLLAAPTQALAASFPVNIPVVNPSFETPDLTDPASGAFLFVGQAYARAGSFEGWTVPSLRGGPNSVRAGLQRPIMDTTNPLFAAPLPDGDQAATIAEDRIWQVLPTVFEPDLSYQLTVSVGGHQANPSSRFGGASLHLFAGGDPGNVVATQLVPTSLVTPGSFTDVSLMVGPDLVAPFSGQSIGIALGSRTSGPHAYFDDVRLAATPLPAAVWMLLTGVAALVGLGARARRQQGPGQA